MKLEIWRDQSDVKGLFGGHKGVSFKLITRVQVSQEETALIAKYKIGDDIVATYQVPGHREDIPFNITVNQLVAGYTANTRDIATLIDLENAIRSQCSNLKNWLRVASTFGGYEAVEI